MSMLRKIQRVGKRASKFQYTATYQSIVVECTKDKWRPSEICVSWTRRGRRFISKLRPWQPSPDNQARGVVIWPEPEVMEITVTLYKGPKDKSYETKEWEFGIIDVDDTGKRKVLATTSINMVRYASSLPYEHDLHLRLKPVSRKIKSVILDLSLTSEFLKEGKATDDDMMSIASMMSVSNLSTIGFLEDEDEDDYNYMVGGRSISPPEVPDHILSTDELIEWAQEIMKDLPNIKISNMTTSWRNGMGFLAIIHYFRPDLLPDFDMQSPNSIKENNRTAFNIAKSLGIACPLTPNMMVTTTIPDKLSVTSFVYQMYQYFTRARQSAITRAAQLQEGQTLSPGSGSRGTSPSSPFDMSKFEMFSNISPVATTPPKTNRVMQYSRHSQENVRRLSGTVFPLEDSNEEKNTDNDQVTSDDVQTYSTPEVHHSGESSMQENLNANCPRIVTEHAQMTTKTKSEISEVKGSCDEERELEPENMNAESDISKTNSSSSLPEDKSLPELPSVIKPVNASSISETSSVSYSGYKYTPGKGQPGSRKVDKPNGRKLPSIPVDTSSPIISNKREDIRKQAQEMLKRVKLDKFKLSSHSESLDSADSQNSSKFRKQAIEMLSEALGTSVTARRLGNEDDLVSGGSSTSLGMISTDDELTSRSADNLDIKYSLRNESCSDSMLGNHQKKAKLRKLPLLITSGNSQSNPANDTSNKSESKTDTTVPRDGLSGLESGNEEQSSLSVKEPTKSPRRSSESNVESNITVFKTKRELEDDSLKERANSVHDSESSSGASSSRSSANIRRASDGIVSSLTTFKTPPVKNPTINEISRTSNRPSSASSTAERTKRATKRAPVARPISAKPSQALLRKVEQNRREEEEESVCEKQQTIEKQGNLTDGDNDVGDGAVGEEGTGQKEMSSTNITPSHKKGIPSPSAWSQHSDDISKDLLITQSEYVKTELLSLQAQVQDLEDRARNIEADIRGAMSIGNKDNEEDLMQEWFGLLNRKNELIKRQIELNMIEKEEDLEKRQFFLNRELRPLMEIPEEQKSTEQKEREAHLLKELIELIDERDKLERRKMINMRNTDRERIGLASAQAKSADFVHGKRSSEEVTRTQSSKADCVIS